MFAEGSHTSIASEFVLVINWWAGMDSNHRKRKLADLQSAPFNHSGTYPFAALEKQSERSSNQRGNGMQEIFTYLMNVLC